MDERLFRTFCDIAYAQAGIRLGAGKEPLVSARIGKRMRALGLPSAQAYLDHLTADKGGEEVTHFLDAISTNFTSFLREPDHFELLGRLVRERVAAGRRELRFWSAASSTGEEPYSMAITVQEAIEHAPVEFRILATDISTRVLAQAKSGVYPPERLEQLTRLQRAQHFARVRDDDGAEAYAVRPEIKDRIVFQRLNLSQPPFPMKGPFDAIFCRNVMIYFDAPVRQRLVREVERLLAPGDLFMVGHSETLTGLQTGLVARCPSIYQQPLVGNGFAPGADADLALVPVARGA